MIIKNTIFAETVKMVYFNKKKYLSTRELGHLWIKLHMWLKENK